MKKLSTLAMLGTLSLSMLFTGNAEASVAEKSEKLDLNLLQNQLLEHIRVEYPNAQSIDLPDLPEYQGMGIRGPAPPLRSVEVYGATSTQHPTTEYFKPSQTSSVYDHGGTELLVITEELGYGHLRYAKFNGVSLKSPKSQHIDLDGDRIVDGWYYWWDASGQDNGNFTYQNTSSVFPGNTMSDSMLIK